MTRLLLGTALLLSLWAVAGCEPPPVAAPEPLPLAVQPVTAPPADAKALVEGGNAFAIELYKKLAAEKGNVVCSPYSVSAALAMTYAGARGDTATEMAKVLGFTALGDRVHPAQADLARRLKGEPAKGQPEFHVANALWGQRGFAFRPEFLTLTQASYGAGLREVDYIADTEGSRRTINGWVGDQTKGKILELIPAGVLQRDTRLVLTNAIYFKGAWLDEFDAARTSDDRFFVTATETVPARLMRLSISGTFFEGDGVQVLRLPYRGDAKSMLLVVPQAVEGSAAVEGKLTVAQVQKWRGGLGEGDAHLELPKFQATGRSRLGDALKAMGMPLAFDKGEADFSGMTDDPRRLFIDAVVHEAVIEVDEQGTAAAAATAVAVPVAGSAPGTPPIRRQITVRADRPFLYLIVDDSTQAILFVGRLAKP